MEQFIFNPLYNKSPLGANVVNSSISYNLYVDKFVKIKSIHIVHFLEGEESLSTILKKERENENNFEYSATVKFLKKGLFWYYFKIETFDETFYLEKNDFCTKKTYSVSYPFLQLIYKEKTFPSKNFSKGVIYHIFVDRFNKFGKIKIRKGLKYRNDWGGEIVREVENKKILNTHCFGGNLYGIAKKLKYLKRLGVSLIYLSPIFEAHSNHKYNVANYSKVDSMFGGKRALIELIDKAKKLNIEILLDGVFNHTGSDSIYFNREKRYKNIGAFQSKKSPYYKWYFFEHFPEEYACWWGIKTLPETNDKEPDFLNYICGKDGIIKKYMKMGIAGFRLDVVDELSDDFLDEISKSIKEVRPDAMIVGEVWEDASAKIAYGKRRRYLTGGQLNSVTNYPIKNSIIEFVKNANLKPLLITLWTILDQYPKYVQDNLMNFLNTHDTARILTVLGHKEDDFTSNENIKLTSVQKQNAIHLLKMASLIQFTIMGIPTIFYGDEAGVEGSKDPFCRACFPWNNENKTLTQWYIKLGELRKNSALQSGSFKFLNTDYNVLIYERKNNSDKVIVAVNKSDYDYDLFLADTMKNFFTNEKTNFIKILPNEFAVLVNTKK